MLKYISLLLFILFQSNAVYATEEIKFVLHLNDTFKFEHLRNTVKNIRKELGDKVLIKVVINGKAVQLMLRGNKTSTKIVNTILLNDAFIGLCHNALRNNHVDKNNLIRGLNILPEDGNVTIFQLQKKGYVYIKM